MSKIILQAAVLLCLFAGFARESANAQTVISPLPIPDPPANYQGTVVWQQPNGSTTRGTISLNVFYTPSAVAPPSGEARLQAQIDLGTAGTTSFYSYFFVGKLDSNGRGILRYINDNLNFFPPLSPQPYPSLNPGRVPVLIGNSRTVAVGGVLAEDGAQFTFRADFVPGIVDFP